MCPQDRPRRRTTPTGRAEGLTVTTLTWIFVLSEWVIRLVMLVYVPHRRSPAAARTWLLLIFVLPWPGLILYVLIGRIYLPKRRRHLLRRAAERVRGALAAHRHTPAPPEGVAEPFRAAWTLARNLGRFEALAGNAVELLDDYDGAIGRLVADIDQAREHVHLLYYIYNNDATGRRVTDALIAAARRGVACRVLLDDAGSHRGLKHLGPRMREAGIEVIAMLPVRLFHRAAARLDLRNHRKIAVIDGRIGYTGSQNIVDAECRPGLRNEEVVIRLTGPAVASLQVVFLADRFMEVESQAPPEGLFPPAALTGSTLVQMLPSGPGHGQANFKQAVLSFIYAAQKRIVLTTPYFVPDDAFQEALHTAVRRGVETHLVVSERSDSRLVALAQASYYESLLEAGVKVHLYKPAFLHAKHISVDDSVVVIGSSNLDIRSFFLDNEVSLILYDAEVAMRLRAIQERYFAHSRLLTGATWQRRPLLVRTVQGVARLADSLL